MLLDGGIYREKRILSEQTVKFMTEGSLTSGQEKGLESAPALLGHTYGNLMRVLKDPGQALSMGNLGEYGWDGWLGCYFSNDPKERMTILAGVQQTDSGMLPIIRKIRNILYRSSF
jgi:CubicO group peptidase (beta-lactamase class C family)